MEVDWQRKKILVWGKTRPELSKKYREIVCTGGIFADTKRLVRLYPIPLRYMNDEKVFKKYQWIEAYVAKSSSDPRPESYKIRSDGISILDTIPTQKGLWTDRATWIMNENNVFPSVEAILDKQRIDGTSLGIVKPLRIDNIRSENFSRTESDAFWSNYKKALDQMDLPLDPETGSSVRPLSPPDYRFKICFHCNDPRCVTGHQFSILDWEIDALYFTCRKRGDSPVVAANKVVSKLTDHVCSDDKDFHFYTGNISSHPETFTVVGLWWPHKKPQPASSDQLDLF